MKLKVVKLPSTYEFFAYARHHLGDEFLMQLWGYKCARMLQAWSSHPTNDSSRQDPLSKCLTMMEELATRGHDQFVLDLLKRIVRHFGLELKTPYQPDKATLDEEALDTGEALGLLIQDLRKAKEDGIIDEEEARTLVARAEHLHRQTGELLSLAWNLLRTAEEPWRK